MGRRHDALRAAIEAGATDVEIEMTISTTKHDAIALQVLDALADNGLTNGEAVKVLTAAKWWLTLFASNHLAETSDQDNEE